jgi:hypothetical protein
MEEGPLVEFEIRAHGQRQGQLLSLEGSQDCAPLSMIDQSLLEKYPGARLLPGSWDKLGSWGVFSVDEKEYTIKLKVVLEVLVGGTWIELEFGINYTKYDRNLKI